MPSWQPSLLPNPCLLSPTVATGSGQRAYTRIPFLQDIYGYYGAAEAVRNVHFPEERHQFTPTKRRAVYDFFIDVFGLDARRCDESRVTIETPEQLQMFGSAASLPEGALRSWEELMTILSR